MAQRVVAFLALLVSAYAGLAPRSWAQTGGMPLHLRAALVSPCVEEGSWREEQRAFRLWWDLREPAGPPLVVQALKNGQWHELGVATRPGWMGPSVPPGQRLRAGAEGEPWIELAIPLMDEPAEFSCVRSGQGGLAGSVVGDLGVGDGGLWITSLGGGLTRLSELGLRVYTRENGLPSNDVISVSVRENLVLAGTSAGAVLLVDGEVSRVFVEGLPGPHVQATLLDPWGGLWFGTDRGLAYLPNVDSDRIQTFESMEPVYALVADESGIWVGSNGLERMIRKLAVWSPRTRVDGGPAHPVYAILGSGSWFTGPGGQLWQRKEGEFQAHALGEELLDIETWNGHVVVAGGSKGLLGVQLDEAVSDQLKELRPRSVIQWRDGLAIGTDSGVWWLGEDGLRPLVLPRPLASGQVWSSGLAWGPGLWIGGERGVMWLGPSRRAGHHLELASRQGDDLVAGLGQAYNLDRDRWVSVDRRGRLNGGEIPWGTIGMTELAGELVFAQQYELCTDLVHDCLELGRIEDVEGGKGGIWVISGQTLVRLEGVRSWPAADLGNIQALLVDRSDRAWVATSRGLEWRVRSQVGLQGEIAWGEAPLQALAWGDKRQQRMWSMTQNGEILELAVDGPRIQNVGVFPSGLPKELVKGATMHASPDGLFILTSRGIYFLRPPRELTAWKR